MSWVKIDDGAPEHPKLVDLSDAGMALWLRALCYCARRRNDGLVPAGALRILSRAKAPAKAAAELVAANLWDVCDDGYRVHDYQDYQPSRAQIEASAATASEAKRAAGKLGGQRSAEVRWGTQNSGKVTPKSKQAVSSADALAQHTVTPDPDPDPDPEIGSTDPTGALSLAAHERALTSIPIPTVGRDLVALARALAAEGTSFGVSVGERADLGKPFTQPQLVALRRIADERASPRASPRGVAPALHAPSRYSTDHIRKHGNAPVQPLLVDDTAEEPWT